MDAAEEIRAERRELYEEQQRILLSKLMSERGGMLMKGRNGQGERGEGRGILQTNADFGDEIYRCCERGLGA